MKTIAKKHFELPAPIGLDRVYQNYLSKNKCWDYHRIRATYSRIDGIVNSASTTTIIEYKERTQPMFFYWNESAILERSKYDALANLAFSLNAQILYIMEFQESVLIYNLNQDYLAYQWESKDCPIESGENSKVFIQKAVTYLPFYTADFIVSKKDWQRKSKEQLTYYLSEIKRRNEEGYNIS
jgi:hypothetical protein